MKGLKKLFAVVLSMAIFLCSLPIIASADSTTQFSDTPLNTRDDFLWGAQMHTPYWSGSYATHRIEEEVTLAYQMGVRVIRVDGSAPEGHLEKLIPLCNEYGIKVLLIGYFSSFSFTEACSDTDAAAITGHFRYLAERFNGLNGYGKIDYMQIGNEVDCAFLNTQYTTGVPNGRYESHFRDDWSKNVATYFKAAIDGVKSVENAPQTIINFSYWHYGFLLDLQKFGIDFDIIGHDWYSDMYLPDNNDYYNSIGAALAENFDKPVFVCEGNLISNESDVASEDNDPTASSWDRLIKCLNQAYRCSNVIGWSFYELMDEPERQTQNNNVYTSEAHFGLMKIVDGKITPKPIYYRLKNLISGTATETDPPIFSTTYRLLSANIGEICSTTVPANTNMYPAYKIAANLSEAMDASVADCLEFDIYASADTDSQIWIWMSDNQDSTTRRGAWLLPLLKKGWNHIVIDITTCLRYESNYDKSTFTDFDSIFFEGVLDSDTDIFVKVANIALTTTEVIVPEMDNEYFFLDGVYSILSSVAVPANTQMYSDYKMSTHLGKSINPVNAKYLEFDMFASAATDNTLAIWISNGYDSSVNRAVFMVPKLKAGWNHIVIDLDNPIRAESGYSRQNFTDFNSFFFEGIPCISSEVTLSIANVAVTADIDPYTVPTANYTYNLYKAADSVDLNGSKTNITDGRYFLWEQYNTQGRIEPTVDINFAEYVEFDYFSTEAETLRFALGSADTYDFYDLHSNYASVDVNVGWNHIVLPISTFLTQDSDTVSAGTYNPAMVSGVIISGISTLYARLTNLAFTNTVPEAEYTYNVIDSVDGIIAFKSWDEDVTDIYNVVANRLFITLPKAIDISLAEYLEFDIYADAQMNDLTIWLCNNLDATGRIRKSVEFSELVTPGQWNHIVLDISLYDCMHGIMDKTNCSSLFFEGDPNPAGVELNIKIANIGVSKNYPDSIPVYDKIATAIEGIAYSNTPTTVPAGSELYSAYQMWNSFTPVDVTNADYIELDIYASEATENRLFIWSAGDGATVRGKWYIPLLKKGWNHVVIDIEKDFAGGNNGFTVDSFTSWSTYYFEGVASNTNTITFKVANILVSKKMPAKSDLQYSGGLISVYNGYTDEAIPANTDLKSTVKPISLPVALNTADIDYIEFNIYVGYDCSLTFNLSSASTGTYYRTLATYELEGLNKGWNSVSIPVSCINAASHFDSSAVKRIYLSGIISDVRESAFAVEDLAFTSKSQTFEIAKGDYNVDNCVDMRDLIHVVNSSLSSDDVWFANVAEFDTAKNGIMDAADITALRKYLFASF